MTTQIFTAAIEEDEEGGYIGWVVELPGANTQGDTVDEVLENLKEAAQMVIEARREIDEREFTGHRVLRQTFQVAV